MKAILLFVLAFNFTTMSFAAESETELSLHPEISVELIEVLNTLDPETLSTLLSPEGLQWYIKQFQRELPAEEQIPQNELFQIIHHGSNVGLQPVQDPRAPQRM